MTAAARFVPLYNQFARSYLPSVEGRHLVEQVRRQRDEAARNYRSVVAAAAAGDDVTVPVLRTLLPHVDTPANRRAGAWIHTAPVVAGDIRIWHERAGWTEPAAWPAKAEAILRFVRWCVEAPDELKQACADFSRQQASLGFQSGTLSPILNALRPDQFFLVNGITVRCINYFAGTGLNTALLTYPRANRAGHQLVDELSDPILRQDGPDLRAGDLFALFCRWLVGTAQFDFPNARYWSIVPGDEDEWTAWQEGGFVALGYDELGDVSSVSRTEFVEMRDELAERREGWSKRSLDGVWRLAHRVQEGDAIVVESGDGTVLGSGSVSGLYYFVPDAARGHCRPVVWEDLQPRQSGGRRGRSVFSEISRDLYQQLSGAPVIDSDHTWEPKAAAAVLREDRGSYARGEEASGEEVRQPAHPLAEVSALTHIDETRLAAWVDAIERKGQAIIYGPPGTGKTYLALELARHLVGGGDGFHHVVQFHPAYTYEDFVQGIRPVTGVEGTVSYRVQPGLFLEFCRRAAERTGTCVLVIDEINRTDPARIFGELMLALEYRERAVPLATGDELRIPQNVRLIGTMNSADRSIALVDYALRRRFAFLALYPDYQVLRRFHAGAETLFPVEPLIALLQRINDEIGDPHYHVGISYFLRSDLERTLPSIWRHEIEPFLEEYFFDQPHVLADFRWPRVAGAILPGSNP